MNEARPNGEMNGVIEVAEKIQSNQAILITSDYLDVELLPASLTPAAQETLERFFRRRNAQKKRIDSRVTALAREIRDYYQQRRNAGIDRQRTISGGDSLHLATAILYNATQFHTFDEGDKDGRSLLDLNGDVAGRPLVICRPPFTQFRLEGLQ